MVVKRNEGPRLSGRLSVTKLPSSLQLKVWGKAMALHQSLESRAGFPIDLRLTNNAHSMLSVRTSPDLWLIRAHHIFVEADAITLDAIVTLGSMRRTTARTRRAKTTIRRFAQLHSDTIHTTQTRQMRLKPEGKTHDLGLIYRDVIRRWTDKDPNLDITWGRKGKATGAERHIRLGSYDANRKLIRIHPLLDQKEVPEWIVGFVVFHEVLHHLYPSREENGRHIHHTREFRNAEALHPDYHRYHAWAQTHLSALIQSQSSPKKRQSAPKKRRT